MVARRWSSLEPSAPSKTGLTNDSYGGTMARRSFLRRDKRRHGRVEAPACGYHGGKRIPLLHVRPLSQIFHLHSPWSILDCQTTGVDGGLRLIEIAIIDHDGRILIETLVNPGVRIPASAIALTGIDEAAVTRAPSWKAIWPKLEGLLLAQHHVIAWSADFDLRALRGECGRCDGVAWTTAIDARFVDLAPIISTLAGRECSFEDACDLASIPPPKVGQQRALSYCRATLRIIHALRNEAT